ncbi:CocE/NonD family hydrolase [Amycolatopsis cynarae]|uniref:CocE/NonD family hydrolase n=1 Tax=Amycolatopsis cynarae TaxID=2995223 RepID=A0ABY7B9T6_9PSEU|nr:CocE/NonD family hydrolase [Amycolatopsis sp. HUAS 11-8]WAL68720.1 CocE/NonD family hydrolase [Amycolatopsis sp. HUAS 11-8]
MKPKAWWPGLPVITLALSAMVPVAGSAAPAQAASPPAAGTTTWKPRPEQWHKTVTVKDLAIPMSDGTILRGDLTFPATADGKAVTQKLPVLVTITPYNKSLPIGTNGGTLLGADVPADYFVDRGYAELWVDARGTGSSEGRWSAFSERESRDAGEVVAWAHRQPWSDGDVGMQGGSYLGIEQLFAAEQQPPGLKAIFPTVPSADPYRDVAAAGGELDAAFLPQWFLLVSGTGAIPPAFSLREPQSALTMAVDHLAAGVGGTLPEVLSGALGGDVAYDGPYWAERKPITHIDKVRVPTFIVGGEYDIFQRGEPLLFEGIQRAGTPVKFIDGPWDHLQAGSGKEIGGAGYGSLAELELRWFDHWIKGMDTGLDQIAPVTYYEQGTGRWVRTDQWIASDLSAQSFQLSGSSATAVKSGGLTAGAAAAGKSILQPLPASGLCTRSTDQWTGGLPSVVLKDLPCWNDNRLNDASGLAFDSAPVTRTLRFQGPINARLYVSTTSGDGLLSLALEDVAPDGSVHRITGGWQSVSQRALDKAKSRYLDGKLIQPWHPFLKSTKEALPPGTIAPVDVEIFPTGAAIQPGHRLRLAVEGFDIPHLAPLPDAGVQALGPMMIYTGGDYPSSVTMPVR